MALSPNILLITTDQQRGDCLGIEGACPVQTPYLDEIAAQGARFTRAYSACPVCVPARRTLLTGQKPSTHGMLMNGWCPLLAPTLPSVLGANGYQTHLSGKLHFEPPRSLHGFQGADWADTSWRRNPTNPDNDYFRFLRRNGLVEHEAMAHGISVNGYPVRPWHLEERFHFSNWCAASALDFLDRRDPTRPFFLHLSLLHPHQPLTPPRDFYDRYINADLPEPVIGDWARVTDEPMRGLPVNAWRLDLPVPEMRQLRAAYYACVNHVDSQIGRVLNYLPSDTVVLFTSDHGEMLGDHQWFRKRTPWEGSARVPFLLHAPPSLGLAPHQVIDAPIELMDVMPTLLDLAGALIPDTVEGRSLLPLLRGETQWREWVHGECAEVPTMNSGMQYLTDGKRKYTWFPGAGVEQFFDLQCDPREMHDLASDPASADEVALWRRRLARELRDRPEGFSDGDNLRRLDGPTQISLF